MYTVRLATASMPTSAAKAIIQSGDRTSGVTRNLLDPAQLNERWRESCAQTMDMFQEAGSSDYEFV